MTTLSPTFGYKAIHLSGMLALALFIGGSSLFVQRDPAFSLRAIASMVERPVMRLEFAAADMSPAPAGNAESLAVLNYHGTLESPDGSLINLTTQEFKQHILALKRAGYETVSVEDLLAWKEGKKQLPKRSIVITFDDGRADSFYGADAILAAAGYQASMYVISGYSLGAPAGGYYLTEYELERMAQGGRWELEAHTHLGHGNELTGPDGETGHFFSSYLWLAHQKRLETQDEFIARVATDLSTVKEKIEAITGKPVIAFAFPFGDIGQNRPDRATFSPPLLAEAAKYFKLLFIQDHPELHFTQTYAEPGTRGPFLIKRIDAGSISSADELLRVLAAGEAKQLPFEDTFGERGDWVPTWNDYSIDAARGTMTLAAPPDATGASLILDGSANWKDYRVDVNVESPADYGVFVWVRFQGDSNNAACNIRPNFAHIEQTVDGVPRVIKGVDRPGMIPGKPFTLTVEVRDRHISCAIDGKTLVDTDFLDENLAKGGIGLKIWNETPGVATVTLSDLKVTALATSTPH